MKIAAPDRIRRPPDLLLKEAYETCPYTIVQNAFQPAYDDVCTHGIRQSDPDMKWDFKKNIRHGGNSLIGTSSEIILATLLTKLKFVWMDTQEEEQQTKGVDFKFKKPKWKNWYTLSCKTANIGPHFDFDINMDLAKGIGDEKVDRFGIVDPYTKRAFIIEASKLIGILRHKAGYVYSMNRVVVDETALNEHNPLDNGTVIKSSNVYDLLEGHRDGATA